MPRLSLLRRFGLLSNVTVCLLSLYPYHPFPIAVHVIGLVLSFHFSMKMVFIGASFRLRFYSASVFFGFLIIVDTFDGWRTVLC